MGLFLLRQVFQHQAQRVRNLIVELLKPGSGAGEGPELRWAPWHAGPAHHMLTPAHKAHLAGVGSGKSRDSRAPSAGLDSGFATLPVAPGVSYFTACVKLEPTNCWAE